MKILLTCNFKNYASHLRRGAQFQKNVQKNQEEGVLSHKLGKKKADDARKTKKIWCVADSRFAARALEAKNAQVPSGKQNFDGRLKPKKEKPNGPKSDKCQK